MQYVSGQVTHFKNSGISRRAGLDFLADGFAFFAVGAHEFVVELEVHPHAGGDAEEGAEAQIVLTRARLPRPRSYGARRVRSCPKRLQAFAVFRGCSGVCLVSSGRERIQQFHARVFKISHVPCHHDQAMALGGGSELAIEGGDVDSLLFEACDELTPDMGGAGVEA